MRISVLGVGTELTSGQIVNRNAAWISKKIKDLGVLTSLHLTVPDERPLILDSLKICAEKSDVVFVTGGLGPTTDDFTREVVAEWAQKQLEWHEPSWQHLNQRLTSRGFRVLDVQKQQCYFPAGSKVLMNSQGTANAFYFETQGKKVFVLPGPPREIEALWYDHIAAWAQENFKAADPQITYSWDTLGYPESEVAKLTEEALVGSGLEIGYRVHIPYVEVKVSYFKSQETQAKKYLEALERNIGTMTALRNGDDAASMLARNLQGFSKIVFQDFTGGSYLMKRIEEPLRSLWSQSQISFSNFANESTDGILLTLKYTAELSAKAEIKKGSIAFEKSFETPIKSPLMLERRQQYFTEMALLFWAQTLQDQKLVP
jgi:molybdenum cofactor synthesis domain-containing protein